MQLLFSSTLSRSTFTNDSNKRQKVVQTFFLVVGKYKSRSMPTPLTQVLIKIYLLIIQVYFSIEFLSERGKTFTNSFSFIFQVTHGRLSSFQISYDKLTNIQKPNFDVLILLHLMDIMVKNSRKHCRADIQNYLDDSESKKLMTTQTVLAHKDAKTDRRIWLIPSISVIFCQAQNTDRTSRIDLY